MAYVLWRVFMKKYSRVRLGLYKCAVTPTGRHVRSFEESSWKPIEDNHESQVDNSKPEELTRNSEERQSKTKRVKNYLKKCKNAISGTSNSNGDTSNQCSDRTNFSEENNCAYWYVEDDDELTGEQVFSDCEVFEKVGPNYNHSVNLSEETLVDDGAIEHDDFHDSQEEVTDETPAPLVENENLTDSLPTLVSEQDEVEEPSTDAEESCAFQIDNDGKGREDVASLVDRLLGPLYPNYVRSRPALVRQARDLLVCEYLGNLTRFETEFCVPAAELLKGIKDTIGQIGDVVGPRGWPLSLGAAGVVVQLGALAPTLLRSRDCYVCVRARSGPGLELALVCRRPSGTIACHPLADPSHLATMLDLEDQTRMEDAGDPGGEHSLPDMLQHLLVSVEHAILRVPLDDLALPCSQCHQYVPLNERTSDATTVADTTISCACQCSCTLTETVFTTKKDSSIQTSPMFEFAGAIPHIDSDEDDDKDLNKLSGSLKHPIDISTPKSIREVPEKLLMSGINLPGTHDRSGRPVLLCDAPCVNRAGLNQYEIALLLLYYSAIPSKQRIEKGLTILLLAETAEEATLDILDKAIILIAPKVNVSSVLVWRPGSKSTDSPILPNSKIKADVIVDEATLEQYLAREQAPASCGGTCTHDQLEWVEFFREFEPFITECQTIGRALLSALADIRDQDVPLPVMRRFLHHQQRQLTRALQEPGLQALRRSGSLTVESLTERAQWLTGSEDVRRRSMYARHSFTVADRVARRLEQLSAERRAALEELARLRALEDEANQNLLWLRSDGHNILQNHCNLLKKVASTSDIKQQEQEFEKFYFSAMRQIDKAGDLLESSNHCQGQKAGKFKDAAQVLKQEISVFSDRLEDVRQRLEDTSRCFDLLARCQSLAEESRTDVVLELHRMTAKIANEKIKEMCQELSDVPSGEFCPASHTPPAVVEGVTSTPIKQPSGQHRRRSVSSFAFIYKCNHVAAGVSCDCWEADSEENTESAKLKKKYVQSLQVQNCACANKSTLDRKNSLGLDNIKEVRESSEDLLETSEKHDSGVSGCGRCDSGLSTGNASSVDNDAVYKRRLQRTCSCQYCNETGAPCSGTSSSGGSHGDHTDHQQYSIEESDVFPKSTGSEELEETDEQYSSDRSKTIPPVAVNSHLHCRASNLDLPNIQDQNLDSKTQKTLLLIMREMIQTERDYVRSLNYVIENYIPELLREDIPQALRGQRNVVFGNIEKIYEFHSQQFLTELEMCENSPLHVGQIFLRHKSKFSLYALYNKNKPKSDSLMTEYGRTFFKSKQLELMDNLDLASYLLKPVQRMGKYALLLQQLMKACPELPDGSSERAIAEREDLISAEEMVKFQLRHGNDLLAMDSIRECDVNLKEQGRLLRQNEFLVSEGRGAKKSLRQVFLFEELILFSKARRFPDRKNLDLYIYKNSIKMTDIGLTAKIGDSPTKFEIWFRKRKPNDTFTLQATSEEMKKLWSEELSKLLWKQAMKNREVRLQEMSSMGIGNKPCLDIRPSADNINDRSISIAQLKTAPRFRNSIVGPVAELCRSNTRPHSIISVSSISSGSTSSQGSSGTLGRHIPAAGHITNLVFDSGDSPHSHHRSHTLNSQCSMESGIIADISIGSDDCPEVQLNNSSCWPLQKSNSQNSTTSNSKFSSSLQTDEATQTQVTLIHVPDDVSINI